MEVENGSPNSSYLNHYSLGSEENEVMIYDFNIAAGPCGSPPREYWLAYSARSQLKGPPALSAGGYLYVQYLSVPVYFYIAICTIRCRMMGEGGEREIG